MNPNPIKASDAQIPVGLYECEHRCGWKNNDFRYGLADAGMSWAMHMDDHRRQDSRKEAAE